MIKTETRDGFTLVTLTTDRIRATFMDLGATILSLCVRDRHGDWQDVVLGYESLTDYETYKGYLGAIIGRTANRIREGRFTLEGTTYQLPVNNGPNCNHGGEKGFAFRTFTVADTTEDSVTFAPFTYAELDTGVFAKLERCPYCVPEKRREVLEEINALYLPGGDHDPVITRAREKYLNGEYD